MKAKGKIFSSLFVLITSLIAVTGVFVFPNSPIKKLNAQNDLVSHSFVLDKDNVTDVEEDDVLGLSFKLRKENATKSGYFYQTSKAIAYEYGTYEAGNDHILVADEGSYYATVELEFSFEDIAELGSVVIYGEFYLDYNEDEPDYTQKTYTTFNYGTSVSVNLLFPKVVIDRVVITYSCYA